jgi:hypothetical protein
MYIFPIIAAAVSFVFAGLLLRQYLPKRKPHQLVWSIAMLLFGIASLTEAIGLLSGWTEMLVKTWYLFGGVLVVGYLALGTLYIQDKKVGSWLVVSAVIMSAMAVLPMLIFNKEITGLSKTEGIILYGLLFIELLALAVTAKNHIAKIWMANLLIGTVAGVIMLINSPVDAARIAADGWEAIERTPFLKGLTMSMNIGGSTILVGGALYSGWTLIRKNIMREVAVGTILIGAGAMLCASGGIISGWFKIAGPAALSISLTLGIVVMFIGFLQTGRSPSKAPSKNQSESKKVETPV